MGLSHGGHHEGIQKHGVRILEGKKLWYCKPFQFGTYQHTRDHEVRKVHKHLCSFCLSQGRYLNHSEKECHLARKSNGGSKNELGAAYQ